MWVIFVTSHTAHLLCFVYDLILVENWFRYKMNICRKYIV